MNGSLDYGALYVDNTGGMHLQCDGFTLPLDAVVDVIPGEVYHAKIVVADAADGIFDSSVFLSVESLCGDSLLHPIAHISKLEFTGPKSIAMNGWLKYGYDEWTWDFGDNSTKFKNQFSVNHTYSKPGLYTVKMYGSNYCCSDTFSLLVPIQLPPYLTKEIVRPATCHGMNNGQILLDVLSSEGGLTYQWSDGDVQQNRSELAPGEYAVIITDATGQSTQAGPFLITEPEQVQAEILQSAPQEEGSRSVIVVPSGGNGGFKYLWNDGGQGASRTDLIQGVDYTVTITDKRGCLEEHSFVFGGGEVHVPAKQLRIFPNPVNSQLRVSRLQEDGCDPGMLTIYNGFGQLVYQSSITCEMDIDLAVDQWVDGLYVLQLVTPSGSETRPVFVKH